MVQLGVHFFPQLDEGVPLHGVEKAIGHFEVCM